jgi:hypothetical protein
MLEGRAAIQEALRLALDTTQSVTESGAASGAVFALDERDRRQPALFVDSPRTIERRCARSYLRCTGAGTPSPSQCSGRSGGRARPGGVNVEFMASVTIALVRGIFRNPASLPSPSAGDVIEPLSRLWATGSSLRPEPYGVANAPAPSHDRLGMPACAASRATRALTMARVRPAVADEDSPFTPSSGPAVLDVGRLPYLAERRDQRGPGRGAGAARWRCRCPHHEFSHPFHGLSNVPGEPIRDDDVNLAKGRRVPRYCRRSSVRSLSGT